MPKPTPPPRAPTPRDLCTPPNAGAAALKPPPRKPPPTGPARMPPPATCPPPLKPRPPKPPPIPPPPPWLPPNQSRARKKRDPIEFSFHDFDFLCLFVWLFLKFIISLA